MAESAVADTPTVENHTFQAETRALLGLMINSLYTHKEVFLRELISNASDALDKVRLRSLTEHGLLGDDAKLEVVIRPDERAGTLTISDNGVGMTKDELTKFLGTIAFSGSREFMQQLSGDATKDAKLIGQFGVGFYSAFLVAKRVLVVTRAAGHDDAWTWTSSGEGSFTLAPGGRARRGTDVVLELRDDQKEFLKPWRLRELVKKYSDFVGHPIVLESEEVEGEGADEKRTRSTETINKGSALWTRPKAELTDEQYAEFYKHVSHDWDDPLARTHFTIEGTQLFTGLLFVPKRAPFDLFHREMRSGIRLYVKRVFIMEECQALLPEYLRFVRGVVDSDDLPLNVSREVLQHDLVVESIKRQVTKKSLEMLDALAGERPDDYATFWKEFGAVLKEGLHLDPSNKDRLAKLLRFESTREGGGLTALADYVGRMKEGQPAIYYISGPDRAFLERSPHIEGLKKKGYEVLFFTDAVDEWVATALPEFEGKKLVSAMKGEIKLEGEEQAEEKKDEADPTWGGLVQAMKDALGDRVKGVRMTERLTDSPACLVAGEHDLGANLERILKQHGQGVGLAGGRRTLELNGAHPLVVNLRELAKEPKHRERVRQWTEVLHDQALLTEGSPIADPVAFAQRMTALLVESTAHELGAAPSSTDEGGEAPKVEV
ncbi:MAG: molecular chaperone HtpG [Planctomycetes bacterium]|nr:molecular chaperone HtpG [Planctomycetota bacterium]